MIMRLPKRKVALVVGGSSGMGKETARRLYARGLDLILLGRSVDDLASAKTGY